MVILKVIESMLYIFIGAIGTVVFWSIGYTTWLNLNDNTKFLKMLIFVIGSFFFFGVSVIFGLFAIMEVIDLW